MMSLLATVAQNPATLPALGALFAALGLSSTAGLRAYLPLLAVAVASGIQNPNGQELIPLQQNFQGLNSGSAIVVLVALVIVEFIIDKVPIVDHISDAVHTIIRPLSGAIIMAGTANSISDVNPWVAAGIGALLALVVHGAKATTRPAVSATTAGIGNPIVSVLEDVVAVVAVALLIIAPVVGFALVIILALVIGRLLFGIVRRFRGRKNPAGVAPTRSSRPGSRSRVIPASLPYVAAPNPNAGGALPSPVTPITPTIPTTPTAPTVAATHGVPYAPAQQYRPNPIAPLPLVGGAPTPTQTYHPQVAGPFPDDATTLPGSH